MVNALADAEARYSKALASLRVRQDEVEAFMGNRELIYGVNRGYVGALAARELGHRLALLPHWSWSVQPVDGPGWIALPTTPALGMTWLTGPGAPYDEGCDVVRGQVLQQMANAFPRRLIVTWIDPVGRGSSAGALLELLEIDKDLLDNQVWTEPEEIDRALRRITDRLSYLEQRCLKNRFADLDDYNLQAGSLA